MNSERTGKDYIQIHKDRLGLDYLNETGWASVATALADDLALTIKRLHSAIECIEARNKSDTLGSSWLQQLVSKYRQFTAYSLCKGCHKNYLNDFKGVDLSDEEEEEANNG